MNDRISRNDMLMSMAIVASQRGTCSRLRVGAIVSRNGRIISTGYNGAPSGLPHCHHGITLIQNDGQDVTPGCKVAEHAERNAIAFAARYGVALEGAEMHTTHAPCIDCARSIVNSGIRRVTYQIPYRLSAGVELLASAGLEIIDLSIPGE